MTPPKVDTELSIPKKHVRHSLNCLFDVAKAYMCVISPPTSLLLVKTKIFFFMNVNDHNCVSFLKGGQASNQPPPPPLLRPQLVFVFLYFAI